LCVHESSSRRLPSLVDLGIVARVVRQEVLRALHVPPRFALFQLPDIDLPETMPV
jgi:hypothetical protein